MKDTLTLKKPLDSVSILIEAVKRCGITENNKNLNTISMSAMPGIFSMFLWPNTMVLYPRIDGDTLSLCAFIGSNYDIDKKNVKAKIDEYVKKQGFNIKTLGVTNYGLTSKILFDIKDKNLKLRVLLYKCMNMNDANDYIDITKNMVDIEHSLSDTLIIRFKFDNEIKSIIKNFN